MEQGVETSQYFVLYLTECVFSRWFCKKEIEKVRLYARSCLQTTAAGVSDGAAPRRE